MTTVTGLRELWNTGGMHNRVRMIVASFLIKDLLINWTQGSKFDPDGAYIRRWVPELAALPDAWIHRP